MRKLQRVYSFVPGGVGVSRVELIGFDAPIERVIKIINQTRGGIVIYSQDDDGPREWGYSQNDNSTITLRYDTTGWSSSDALQIVVDDGVIDVNAHPEPASLDAAGRIRVSNTAYRFDSQHTYGVDADMWDSSVTGAATVAAFTATRTALLTTAGAGASAVLQSHYHVPYTPGRSQLAKASFVFGEPVTGITQRVGYCDGENGFMFERNGADCGIRFLSTTMPGEFVPQAAWNIDPMNGRGPSGLFLSDSKAQLFCVQLLALYVGEVVVGFEIEGRFIPVHKFDHGNTDTTPYMAIASLPIRYEMTQSGASSGALHAICSMVTNEGGEDLFSIDGKDFSVASSFTSPKSVSTRAPVLSLRMAQLVGSVKNNSVMIPLAADVFVGSNAVLVEVVYNGTLTGATFSGTAAGGMVDVDTAATAISGGTVVEQFFVQASGSTRASDQRSLIGKAVMAYSHLLNKGDTLTVVATSRTGAADVTAAIKGSVIR